MEQASQQFTKVGQNNIEMMIGVVAGSLDVLRQINQMYFGKSIRSGFPA